MTPHPGPLPRAEREKKRRLLLLLLLWPAAGAVLLISCSSIERTVIVPPNVEGAIFVGNKACFECHGNITRVFPASPHARMHFEGAKLAGQTGCEACHGPGSMHVQDPKDKTLRKLINPWKIQARLKLEQDNPNSLNFADMKMLQIGNTCRKCHDEDNDVHWDIKKWKKVEHYNKD